MGKTKKSSRKRNYSATAGLTDDEKRWNKVARRKKGAPGSREYKRYIWGHKTNVQKGRK